MEKVKKFLEEYKKNPQAAELLAGEVSLSADEYVKRLADAAQKLGFDVSEAELKDYFENARKKVKEKTDSVAAAIEAESDEALEEVAGGDEDNSSCGKYNNCGLTYSFYCEEVIYEW